MRPPASHFTERPSEGKPPNSWLFAREALASWSSLRRMGTILPAQPHLARAVARTLPRHPGMTIVELGAGEGCLTRAITRRMDGLPYRLVAIELNETLVRASRRSLHVHPRSETGRLKEGCLCLAHGDAIALDATLRRLEIRTVDAVVSSLPFFHLARRDRRRLMRHIRWALRPSGTFVQYRYTPAGRAELRRYFRGVQRRFVMNLLPAWIFACINPYSSGGDPTCGLV